MPVGFRNPSQADFDALFDPYVSGTPAASSGFPFGGPDFSTRYAPISVGLKGPDVGFRTSSGLDVSNLWAAIGTAVYTIAGLQGKQVTAQQAANTNQGSVSAVASVSINSDGQWAVSAGTGNGPYTVPPPTSGTWLPSGTAVADWEVQFAGNVSGTGQQTFNNGAPTYVSPTTSRGYSLQLPALVATNAIERSASSAVTIRLRKIATGQVQTTTLALNVYTAGFA